MGKKIVVLAALLALLVMYLLPIGVVPGFFIGGTEQQVPAKWEDTSGIDEVRLRAGDRLLLGEPHQCQTCLPTLPEPAVQFHQ